MKDKPQEAAYWGTMLESVVRDEFAKRTGLKVAPVNYILQSREYPFMLANLDGAVLCPTHGKCVFEAKTASAFKAGEWEDDAVPYSDYASDIRARLRGGRPRDSRPFRRRSFAGTRVVLVKVAGVESCDIFP